ncbi:MAG: gamma-glutamyl-gamma-aminobutyrate hydrolase family protein [Roseiflexaceae bacterium]|nr:gamma-glutamyl-gamma-aminobutyrate hydrolase family protein [Roseiflexaceae bacterium]
MQPVIGIPCATIRDKEWCPLLHGHRQTYIDAVVRAGGVPILVPLIDNQRALRRIYDMLDGVLLAGGGDVNPTLYGEEPIPELGTIDELRDIVELPLVQWALADGKPILGICRGVQVLNVALGGTLYQDIPAQLASTVHDQSYTSQDWTHMAHDLQLAEDSDLAELFGTTEFPTNSLHHQALKDVAPGLRAVGWAPDGVVEAVESTDDRFIVGLQCHPEALQGEADPRWQALFRRFVERCELVAV